MSLKRTKLLITFWHLIYLLLTIGVVSCGPVDSSTNLEGYPVERPTSNPDAYPIEPVSTRTGILLAIDRPVEPNQTTVTGVGPAGLQVTLLNITFLGEELGTTVINDDGTFLINVNPLPAGVRIGLTADLATSGLTESDVRPGEGEVSTPRVGYFFDSVVIPQQD